MLTLNQLFHKRDLFFFLACRTDWKLPSEMGNYPLYSASSLDREACVYVQVAQVWVAGLSQACSQLETYDQRSILMRTKHKNLTYCCKRVK